MLILAADAFVVLLHVAARLAGVDKRLFDLDQEQNLPTWLSSVQFFGVALCAVLLSTRSAGNAKLAWRVLAGIFVFLSIDELALLHEELVDRVATSPSGDAWFWPVFYVPLAVAVLVALRIVLVEVRLRGGSIVAVLAGLALLAAALAFDAAAVQFVDNPWLFEPELVLEESCELVGTALLIATFLALFLARDDRPQARQTT